MSLVVACNCRGCQYWCGDRILVDAEAEPPIVVATDYKKVRRTPGMQALIGISGSAYDADLIWQAIVSNISASSVESLLSLCSSVVREVNQYSSSFAASRSIPVYRTGLIVGGYNDNRRFLTVIEPDGDVVSMSVFAAIGDGIIESDCEVLRRSGDNEEFDSITGIIDGWFNALLERMEYRGAVLDRYIVTPEETRSLNYE